MIRQSARENIIFTAFNQSSGQIPVTATGAAIAAIFLMSPAMAQAEEILDEIVVTAERREVDIQRAAIAVSVVSGEDFARSEISNLDNLNGYLPGLSVTKNDGAGRVVSIRGVGWETAQNLSTQPSVLLYTDGIYVANPIAIATILSDLERVEVFRGPQGTEFGQGTTGGAINLVTKRPRMDGTGGDVNVGIGTYNLVRTSASLNMPLNDESALRASVQKYSRSGFAEIDRGTFDGYELDDADALSGRLSLLWEPGDKWSVYVTAFLHDSDQHAAAQKNVDDPNPDPRKLSQDFPGKFEMRNEVYSVVIGWKSPTGIDFKSISGYQEMEKEQSVDGDRLNETLTSIDIPGFFVTTANWDVLTFWDNDSEVFSQEFNANFDGEDADWILGAYYLDHKNFNHFLEANGPAPFSDSTDALANPGPDTLPPFQSVLNFVEARTVSREDWAVYAQTRIDLSDKLSLVAGARYQEEDQLDEAVQFFTNASSLSLSDNAVTWKIGLDFNITDNNFLYALLSTGWKNGGTNPGALNGAIDVPLVFQPAELTSYEIGSKNMFGDDRVRLNISGFLYDYENLQFMQEDPVPFAGGTGNISKTDIYGVETEFAWAIVNGWHVEGQVTWMDGRISEDLFTLDAVDFRDALEPGVGLFTQEGFDTRLALSQSTNLKGNDPPKLVDWTARLTLTNQFVTSSQASLTSRLEFVHRGEYQYRVYNHPLVDTVPDYNIANIYFQYEPHNSPLSFALTASNLFNEDGINSRFSNPFGLLTTSEEFIPPLQVVASLRYEF